MILTGSKIIDEVREGRIVIDPFDAENVGPNSVDLRLADTLLVYGTPGQDKGKVRLDAAAENPTHAIKIRESGVWLEPGVLYLGATVERCGSDEYVPCIEGRSSMARLGISAIANAGFGDIGWGMGGPDEGHWTLEITAVHPVRVYAGMRIVQAYFMLPYGMIAKRYRGKYRANSAGPVASQSFKDFSK